MINMILTTIILILLFSITSILNTNKKDLKIFSFYHTEIAKGVAVFIILISHIGDKSGLRIFTPLGGIGVSIFLICSGYGLFKSYLKNGLNQYIKKRFIGLLIPYWIVLGVFSIINFNTLGFTGFLKGALLIRVPSIFWYVQYIAIFYLVFYVAFKYLGCSRGVIAVLLFSIAIFIMSKSLLLGEQSFAFIIGIQLAKFKFSDEKLKAGISGTVLIVIGIASLLLKQTALIREANYIIINLNGVMIKTITGLGIIFILYILMKYKVFKIFCGGGKYSYEIYLAHMPLVEMLVGKFTVLNICLFLAVSIISTILLRILSTQTIKYINKAIVCSSQKI